MATFNPDTVLLNWLIALPFFAAVAAELFPRLAMQVRSPKEAEALGRGPFPLGALTCAMGIAISSRLLSVAWSGTDVAADYWWTTDLYHLRLRADVLSSALVLVIYGLGLLAFLHLGGVAVARPAEPAAIPAGGLGTADRSHHRAALALVAVGAGAGAALAADIVLMVFCLEVCVLAVCALAWLDDAKRAGAMLVNGHLAGLLLALGVLLMWRQAAETSLEQLPFLLLPTGPGTLRAIALVALLGLWPRVAGGVGYGLRSTASASAPRTGLLASPLLVVVAGAVLLRLLPGSLLLPTVPALRAVSLIAGLLTLWKGAVRAWLSHELRARAGWLTVAQAGYLLVALAGAAAPDAPPAFLQAACYQVVSAPVAVLALWLACSAVLERVGTDALPGLSGLLPRLPSAALGLLVGGLSLVGLPGLAGFNVQRLLLSGILAEGSWPLAAAVVLTDVALALIVLDTFRRVFLRGERPPAVRPGSVGLALPLLVVTALLILGGVWGGPLAQWSQSVSSKVLSFSP